MNSLHVQHSTDSSSQAMGGHQVQDLHFVIVPLMAQGHILPCLDMARLFADRGVLVSFITTPMNAARIKPVIDRFKEKGLPIRFVPLPFPCKEAGLPEGCEFVDVIKSGDLIPKFFEACKMLHRPLELYLKGTEYVPSCIISDFCLPWSRGLARDLHIPWFSFHGISCFAHLCQHNIRVHNIYGKGQLDENEPFVVPGLPHRVEVTRAQAPGHFSQPSMENFRAEAMEAEDTSDGLVANTFDALESSYIDGLREATGKKVWTIGPLSLCNKDVADRATRGNKASVDEDRVLRWLDSKAPRSVVYVSFGSLVRTTTRQLVEIGHGVEASGHPFIWAIRAEDGMEAVEEWISSEGLEEERKGEIRCLIIRGWAPQVMILSHPAVGGFVTHCGWNSCLEGISAGVPMVTWPHFAEQFLNEKMLVELVGVGVAVGIKRPTKFTPEEERWVLGREHVERAVKELMGGNGGEGCDEKREERRRKAAEMGELATMATEEGVGSSFLNITGLIQRVQEHAISRRNLDCLA